MSAGEDRVSRTDKDRPPWVRARDEKAPREWHHWRCETKWPSPYWTQVPCDLISERGRSGKSRCYLVETLVSWRSGDGPPQWFRDHRWFNPERVRERDGLKSLVKEFNAGYDLDGCDFPNYHHRNSAKWDWW